MSTGDAHTFRFFVDVACRAGLVVDLADGDARHARVLRLADGDVVELVDGDGATWLATFDGADAATVGERVATTPRVTRIELVAGALTGNRFDELVDGAVQGGADRVVPLVANRRDAERLTQRRERLTRVAEAASKQSKRASRSDVTEPVDVARLLELGPGILLDADAAQSLLDVPFPAGDLRLLVGPADGLDRELVEQLLARGWVAARLGPTILRAELAAAVAVAIGAMRLSR